MNIDNQKYSFEMFNFNVHNSAITGNTFLSQKMRNILEDNELTREEKNYQQKLTAANISKKYFDLTLVDLIGDKSTKFDEYLDEIEDNVGNGRGLFISQTTKRVGCILAKYFIEKKCKTFYWHISDILRFTKSTFSDPEKKNFYDYVIKNADVLIIDGFNNNSKEADDFEMQEISQILMIRESKTTILSSTRTVDDLESKINQNNFEMIEDFIEIDLA